MSILVDNSAILEAGEYLVDSKKLFKASKKHLYVSGLDNLMKITKAILGGDQFYYVGNKIDKNSAGVDFLLRDPSLKQKMSDISNIITNEKENSIVDEARNRLENEAQILAERGGQPYKFDDKLINPVIASELDTFLGSQGDDHEWKGLEHYWNNIGLRSAGDEERRKSYIKLKKLISLSESSNKIISNFINRNFEKSTDSYEMVATYRFLPLISNLVRLESYNLVAVEANAHYQPFSNRVVFAESAVNMAHANNRDIHDKIGAFISDPRLRDVIAETVFLITLYVLNLCKSKGNKSKSIGKLSSFFYILLNELNDNKTIRQVHENIKISVEKNSLGDAEISREINDIAAHLDDYTFHLKSELGLFSFRRGATQIVSSLIKPESITNLRLRKGSENIELVYGTRVEAGLVIIDKVQELAKGISKISKLIAYNPKSAIDTLVDGKEEIVSPPT